MLLLSIWECISPTTSNLLPDLASIHSPPTRDCSRNSSGLFNLGSEECQHQCRLQDAWSSGTLKGRFGAIFKMLLLGFCKECCNEDGKVLLFGKPARVTLQRVRGRVSRKMRVCVIHTAVSLAFAYPPPIRAKKFYRGGVLAALPVCLIGSQPGTVGTTDRVSWGGSWELGMKFDFPSSTGVQYWKYLSLTVHLCSTGDLPALVAHWEGFCLVGP